MKYVDYTIIAMVLFAVVFSPTDSRCLYKACLYKPVLNWVLFELSPNTMIEALSISALDVFESQSCLVQTCNTNKVWWRGEIGNYFLWLGGCWGSHRIRTQSQCGPGFEVFCAQVSQKDLVTARFALSQNTSSHFSLWTLGYGYKAEGFTRQNKQNLWPTFLYLQPRCNSRTQKAIKKKKAFTQECWKSDPLET